MAIQYIYLTVNKFTYIAPATKGFYMTYTNCKTDFDESFEQVRTEGGGNYHFQKLKNFETRLTTPSLIGLFKEVEYVKGSYHKDIVDCVFVDNPSEYFNSLDSTGYEYAGIDIDLRLNEIDKSHREWRGLINRGKSNEFSIRSDKDFQPYNL